MAHTFEFPQDLLDSQAALRRVEDELQSLYDRLPWSVAPQAGWTRSKEAGGHYFASSRPDSPGWTTDEQAQVEALRTRRLELATAVVCHAYWATSDDPPKARSALKHQSADE
ncbi:hypothetical protein [Streptomyces lunalinharesii]|uniref:hypothetical protein n=1 Tax=Streptomyces lunalinharesii TaxID=333384 RepID=UPI0031DECF18